MFTRSACVSWLRFVFVYPQDRLRYRSSLEGLSPGEMRRVHRHRRHAKHFEETPIVRCLLLLLVLLLLLLLLVVAEGVGAPMEALPQLGHQDYACARWQRSSAWQQPQRQCSIVLVLPSFQVALSGNSSNITKSTTASSSSAVAAAAAAAAAADGAQQQH